MAASLKAQFPADHLEVGTGQWLVAAEETLQSLTGKLNVGPASAQNAALIVSAAGYWGAKPSTVWEWLKAKWGSA